MSSEISPRTDPTGYYSVAFYAGCIAAAAMALVLFLARATGLTRMDLSLELGSIINPVAVPGVWCLGFMLHVVFGGVFALLYAAILDTWSRPGAMSGAVLGAVHAVVAGLAFAFLIPLVHDAVPGRPLATHPGFMGLNFGAATVPLFAIIYVIYGAIVGAALNAAQRGVFHFSPPQHAGTGYRVRI